ncbi:MAG: PTS fructose transporter subunit IIA [Rhodoferax sp.]|nr:PTS fructose transporter subunit IIA [Rhodoferax sp.]
MNNGILIIAHAPLASALRLAVLHVFPDCRADVAAFDVEPGVPPEASLAGARRAMAGIGAPQTLVVADVFGATPCNVAQKLVDGLTSRLVAGVNLPMLLRAVTYRHEALDTLVTRAIVGGTQGVMQVAITAPQNQTRKHHGQGHDDNQQ